MKAFEYDSGFMKFAILLSRLTLKSDLADRLYPGCHHRCLDSRHALQRSEAYERRQSCFRELQNRFPYILEKRNCDLADHRSIQCHLRYGILPVPDSTYSLSYGTDGHLRHGFPYIIISSDLDLSDNGEFLRKVARVIFQCIYLRFYVRTCHTDRSGILWNRRIFIYPFPAHQNARSTVRTDSYRLQYAGAF